MQWGARARVTCKVMSHHRPRHHSPRQIVSASTKGDKKLCLRLADNSLKTLLAPTAALAEGWKAQITNLLGTSDGKGRGD